jgi:hypothetical protein
MSTTIDDLIAVKDQALSACYAVVAKHENGDLAVAVQQCREAIEYGELYDAAEESDAVSIEDYEENYGATFTAHFQGEAWVNDNAVPTDDEGDDEWDCTAFAHEHMDYVRGLEERRGEYLDGSFGIVDNDDVFKSDPAAPEWVRDWQGPFTIRIRRG